MRYSTGVGVEHRVYRVAMATFWREPGESGGPRVCTPFHYIYHHVQRCDVRSSGEGRYTPPYFYSTPIWTLWCGRHIVVGSATFCNEEQEKKCVCAISGFCFPSGCSTIAKSTFKKLIVLCVTTVSNRNVILNIALAIRNQHAPLSLNILPCFHLTWYIIFSELMNSLYCN